MGAIGASKNLRRFGQSIKRVAREVKEAETPGKNYNEIYKWSSRDNEWYFLNKHIFAKKVIHLTIQPFEIILSSHCKLFFAAYVACCYFPTNKRNVV